MLCSLGTQHATETVTRYTPKSTKSRISNSPVLIEFQPKSHSEFVPRDTKESKRLDLVDSGEVWGGYDWYAPYNDRSLL